MTIRNLYPTIRPSLDLNFAKTKRLDPRVTFSRVSSGAYVGADGLIKTAVANEPRFDHDPATGQCKGLLIEESRTNRMQYSIISPSNGWSQINGGTVTQNAAIAPDGTNTAALISFPGSGSDSRVERYEVSNTNVSGLVDSLWVRSVSGTVSVRLSDGSTFTDHTVGTNWTRISHNRSVQSNYFFKINTANASLNYSFYVWGAQTEIGSFPTSYIPTSGSTVTRSADVASIAGTNFSSWYNQSGGTWFGEVLSAYVTGQRLFEVGNSSDNQYSVSVRPGSTFTSFARWASGANGVNHSYPAKFAVADSVTDIQGCVNGALANIVSTGNSVIDDKLVLGGEMTGTSSANSIARLTYWPTRLSDAMLQNLTR